MGSGSVDLKHHTTSPRWSDLRSKAELEVKSNPLAPERVFLEELDAFTSSEG
jgi:hypothetical protein